jgi:hypothetical protein
MNILTFINNAKKIKIITNLSTHSLTHLHAKNIIKINTHLREESKPFLYSHTIQPYTILHYLGGFDRNYIIF